MLLEWMIKQPYNFEESAAMLHVDRTQNELLQSTNTRCLL